MQRPGLVTGRAASSKLSFNFRNERHDLHSNSEKDLGSWRSNTNNLAEQQLSTSLDPNAKKNLRAMGSSSQIQKKGTRTAGQVSPMKKKLSLNDIYRQQAKGKNKHVDLVSKNLSDQHVKELSAAIKNYPVKSLDLSGNALTDEGLKHLSKAICESGIERVNLAKNRIGEKNIEHIVQILKMSKTLRQINLNDNHIFSRVGKNKFKNGLVKAGYGGRGIEVLV